jgi:hypothetical protein
MQPCVILYLKLDSLRETLLHTQIVSAMSRTDSVSGCPPELLLCNLWGTGDKLTISLMWRLLRRVDVSPIFNIDCCWPVAANGPLKVANSSLCDRGDIAALLSALCGVMSPVRGALQPAAGGDGAEQQRLHRKRNYSRVRRRRVRAARYSNDRVPEHFASGITSKYSSIQLCARQEKGRS